MLVDQHRGAVQRGAAQVGGALWRLQATTASPAACVQAATSLPAWTCN